MPCPSDVASHRPNRGKLSGILAQYPVHSCQVGVAVNAEDSGQPRCSQVLSGLLITAVLRGKRIEAIAQMLEDSEEKAYRCRGQRGRKVKCKIFLP